jgi:hypothetical protein
MKHMSRLSCRHLLQGSCNKTPAGSAGLLQEILQRPPARISLTRLLQGSASLPRAPAGLLPEIRDPARLLTQKSPARLLGLLQRGPKVAPEDPAGNRTPAGSS